MRKPALFMALAVMMVIVACGSDSRPASTGSPTSQVSPPTPATLYTPAPMSVQLSLDAAHSSSVTITASEGGSIEAVAADGTRYVLTIPDDALLADTEITMTPVTAADGVPVEGGKLVGVDMEPEGLRFYSPGVLVVHPAGVTGAVEALSFSYAGGGEELHLYPPVNDPETLSFNIFHFSGHIGLINIGEGTQLVAEEPVLTAEPDSFNPTDWERQFEHVLGEILNEERNAQLRGESPNPQLFEILERLMADYYFQIISDFLPGIRTDCGQAKANSPKVLAWSRNVELFGIGEKFDNEKASIMEAVTAGADNCWNKATEPCIDVNDQAQFSEVTATARMNILLVGNEAKYNPQDPILQCSECADFTDIETLEGPLELRFSDRASDGDRTMTIERSLTGKLELHPLGQPLPGADGRIREIRYTGEVKHGQSAVSEISSVRGGSPLTVIGGGEPEFTHANLSLRLYDCTYQLNVQWSTDAVHSGTGLPSDGGGFLKLSGPMPAGGKQPVIADSRPVHTYYLPGAMAEPPAEFFNPTGTLIYALPVLSGSERFADANAAWSLAPGVGQDPAAVNRSDADTLAAVHLGQPSLSHRTSGSSNGR